jgi:hypothetical protein
MANYGELLEDFNPERDEIYIEFVKYFNNPTMTKIKDIEGQFSMYATKVYSLLSNENRYLICITHKNNMNIGTVEELRTIIKTENSNEIVQFLIKKGIFINQPKCLRCQNEKN